MKNKIEIGEYVRTDEGYILKENDKEFLRILIEGKSVFGKVVKHSKNLIDLIEVGDVLEVYFPFRKITRKVCVDEYFKDSLILNGIISKNVILKQILTKEQFNRNCYEVEE